MNRVPALLTLFALGCGPGIASDLKEALAAAGFQSTDPIDITVNSCAEGRKAVPLESGVFWKALESARLADMYCSCRVGTIDLFTRRGGRSSAATVTVYEFGGMRLEVGGRSIEFESDSLRHLITSRRESTDRASRP